MRVALQGCLFSRKAHRFRLLEGPLPTVSKYSSHAVPSEGSDPEQPWACYPSSGPQILDSGSLLKRCLHALILLETQVVHHHILKHGLEEKEQFEGLLIQNYSRFGAIKDALCLFHKSHGCDLGVWNSLISVYACRRMHSEAFLMLARMQQEAYAPDKVTFMQTVALCARHADLAQGMRVHACIRFTNNDTDIFLGTSIIKMYDKCKSLKDAYRQWQEMPIQNEVSWTAIISCHVHQGRHEEALHLFVEMQKQGVKPNKVTFVCILDVFAAPSALAGGQLTYSFITESGFEFDAKFGIPLISMYKDCGSVEDAKRVFEKLVDHTTTNWNAMISTFVQYRDLNQALDFFFQSQKEGFLPDQATFVSIVGACATPEAIREGKQMHVRVLEGGFESEVKVATALINMYGRCSLMKEADLVFSKMRKRDVVSWTSIFAMFSQHNQPQRAMDSFNRMLQDGIEPSKVTFVCILDTFTASVDVIDGNHMHAFVVEAGHADDHIVGNALLSMYSRFGYLQDARNIFDKLSTRTVVSWTAMIGAYAQHDQPCKSLELYNQMFLNNSQPNLVTCVNVLNACALELTIAAGMLVHTSAVEYGLETEDLLISALACMYGKLGSSEDSEALINRISQDSELFWNAKVALHSQQGLCGHLMESFAQTESRGFKPSVVAYVSVLDVCASCAVLEDGELVHFSAINSGCDADTNVATALMNMYGRCGSLEAAWRIFDRMDDQNVIAWSAMIALHGQHGLGQDALSLFEQMQCSCAPNKVTSCSVLDACNHSGLISEAWECFLSIIQSCTPIFDLEHYVSVIDLFGRSGCLDVGNFLVENMPHKPITLLYVVLLGACKYHGDVNRAVEIAKFIMELDPENKASYILLSNMYASAADEQSSLLARFVDDEQLYEGQVLPCVAGKCGIHDRTKSLETKL